jgi:hypothetical protein
MHKNINWSSLLQVYTQMYSKEIYFVFFMSFISFSMYFRSLIDFLKILNQRRKFKTLGTVSGQLSAHGPGLLAQRPCRHMPRCMAGCACGGSHRVHGRRGGAPPGGLEAEKPAV